MVSGKIKPEMRIAQVLRGNPKLKKAFNDLGLNCTHCKGAATESIAFLAMSRGMKPEQMIAFMEKYLKKTR